MKIFNFFKKVFSKIKTIDKTFFKIFCLCLALFLFVIFIPKLVNYKTPKANVLVILKAVEPMNGLMHWQIELDNRNQKAAVLVSSSLAEKYPDFFINMHGRGYKLIGYSEQDFWGMPYENQLDIMTKTKQVFNNLLEIDLDVFATENFSYDINTLKLAQELDINYLLKRGTTEEDSTIYNLTDFDVKLISLSNVKDSHLNSTPISDHDLHIRGADIVEWEKHINNSITKKPKAISVISDSYLGGTRKIYWTVYRLLLNSNHIDINDFDTWLSKANQISVKNINVPINKEVGFKQVPYTPIDSLEPITNLDKYTTTPKEKGKCPKGTYCY